MTTQLKCHKCDFIAKNITSLGTHAAMKHSVSGEELYCVLNNVTEKPRCACGCGEFVTYVSLTKGYKTFVKGHTTPELRAARGKKISKTFLENPELHGSKTDAVFGNKVSKTRKEMFASGELTSPFAEENFPRWNLGKTKRTCEKVTRLGKSISSFWASANDHHLRLDKDEILHRLQGVENKFVLVSEISNYRNQNTKLSFVCQVCKTVTLRSVSSMLKTQWCQACSPKESKAQLEIYDFVKSLAEDAVLSDRTQITPLELDIWIPSKRFAIEYHGLYYHSDAFEQNDSSRHAFKHFLCKQKEITLLQVFEDEWRDKRQIVESMIKHRLGLSRKLHARKTEIVELGSKESAVFFDVNHIDGSTVCQKTFGLVLDRVVVAALSLRSPYKKNASNTLEIARFATLAGCSVSGGLSRLLSQAIKYAISKQKTQLLTYLDTRLGGYDTYTKVGFKFDGETSIRFWWTDLHQRFSRQTYKAVQEKTEREVANDAGVHRIYGCKNTRFVLYLNKDENQED